jgi:hypothetical protein
MASVPCTDVQARPTKFVDVTSWTLDECQQLVPPFEAAFQAHKECVAARWETPDRSPVARRPAWSMAVPAGSAAVSSRLWEDLLPPRGPGTRGRHGLEQSPSGDACPPPPLPGSTPRLGRCHRPLPARPGPAARCCRGRRGHGGPAPGGRASACRRRSRCGVDLPLLPMTRDGTTDRPPPKPCGTDDVGERQDKGPHGKKRPARQCRPHHRVSEYDVRRACS